MTLVGCCPTNFTGRDGDYVSGWHLYFLYDASESREKCIGQEVERIFLSDVRLKELHFVPSDYVGSVVQLTYNKFGKVASIIA